MLVHGLNGISDKGIGNGVRAWSRRKNRGGIFKVNPEEGVARPMIPEASDRDRRQFFPLLEQPSEMDFFAQLSRAEAPRVEPFFPAVTRPAE